MVAEEAGWDGWLGKEDNIEADICLCLFILWISWRDAALLSRGEVALVLMGPLW